MYNYNQFALEKPHVSQGHYYSLSGVAVIDLPHF